MSRDLDGLEAAACKAGSSISPCVTSAIFRPEPGQAEFWESLQGKSPGFSSLLSLNNPVTQRFPSVSLLCSPRFCHGLWEHLARVIEQLCLLRLGMLQFYSLLSVGFRGGLLVWLRLPAPSSESLCVAVGVTLRITSGTRGCAVSPSSPTSR